MSVRGPIDFSEDNGILRREMVEIGLRNVVEKDQPERKAAKQVDPEVTVRKAPNRHRIAMRNMTTIGQLPTHHRGRV